MDIRSIGVLVAALVTVGTYTYLFGSNPVHKFIEHAYGGVVAAWAALLTLENLARPTVEVKIVREGQWWLILPMLFGGLLYCRYSKKWAHLARYPTMLMLGFGSGIVLTRDFRSMFLNQIIDTVRPLSGADGLGNAIILLGVICTLLYFVFTIEHKGVMGAIGRVGRYTIMVALGASFGNTVMARVSLLLGRLQFLLGDWLGVLR